MLFKKKPKGTALIPFEFEKTLFVELEIYRSDLFNDYVGAFRFLLSQFEAYI